MTLLNAANPITLENRTMSDEFRTWTLAVSNALPIVGTGSPEGVVGAPQYSLYIDSTGGTGTIEYRKMLTEIGGDTSKGWVLV